MLFSSSHVTADEKQDRQRGKRHVDAKQGAGSPTAGEVLPE
jgi:hypothetical protein